MDRLKLIQQLVGLEAEKAFAKFKPYNSAHEGSSVIREEFEELWFEIMNNKVPLAQYRQLEEAIQVASTAIRFIHDLAPDVYLAMLAAKYGVSAS